MGKSSILNALVGEERAVVSDLAGTTRDSVDTLIAGPEGRNFRLVDTAGMRRRAKVLLPLRSACAALPSRTQRAVHEDRTDSLEGTEGTPLLVSLAFVRMIFVSRGLAMHITLTHPLHPAPEAYRPDRSGGRPCQ